MSDGPFTWSDFKVTADETLPPNCIKVLVNGKAVVFQLDLYDEHAQPIAEWPEVQDQQKVEDR